MTIRNCTAALVIASIFALPIAAAPIAAATQSGPNVSNLSPDLTMTQTNGSASLRTQPHVRAPMNQWPMRNYRGNYNRQR